ncbi:adhesion regulating molecule 1 [Haplosporangium sp. Z 27]|nr:adhesion regulating molecule 1 [Haplosporangium sp. Z 27]
MASRRAPLLQFKAGRCFRDGTTNTVKPDSTKGLVYMEKDDDLMHFYWKNRTTNTVDDDLILFPGDAELKIVPECTTGRVLMLQFKSSSQKLFYWLQEANADRDQIILQQANSLINQGQDDEAGQFGDEDVTME